MENKKSKNSKKPRTIALVSEVWFCTLTLPLSQVAFVQVLSIQHRMENSVINEDAGDVWTYSGGSSKFKSAVAYRKLLGHQEIDPAFKWLWKSCCQPKHKVFFWLLLKDRLSTKEHSKKKAYGSRDIQLWNLFNAGGRNSGSPVLALSICLAVLGSLKSEYNSNRRNFWKCNGHQRSNAQSILHGSCHPYELDNLEGKEWAYFQ